MNFFEYQKEAAKTAIYPNKGRNLTYVTLGLVGEAGEIANKVKKILRDDNGNISFEKAQHIYDEIGDVLWYIAALADELGFSLQSIAIDNIVKLRSRAEKGTLRGSGDQR